MFTDKTGTLTENNMEFIECCVDGHVYVPHVICNGQVTTLWMDVCDYLFAQICKCLLLKTEKATISKYASVICVVAR